MRFSMRKGHFIIRMLTHGLGFFFFFEKKIWSVNLGYSDRRSLMAPFSVGLLTFIYSKLISNRKNKKRQKEKL